MKIAWIGIGVMGESMAGHLLDAGHELFVYNRTVSKTDGLVKRGATLLKEVKDAPLNANVIFSMVGYPKDVEEVYLGENGLIKTAKEGQVFVDMTTSSPTLAKKISETYLLQVVILEQKMVLYLLWPVVTKKFSKKLFYL